LISRIIESITHTEDCKSGWEVIKGRGWKGDNTFIKIKLCEVGRELVWMRGIRSTII
jgi:hypothetical protein